MKTKCHAMVLVAPERMEMQTFDLPEIGARMACWRLSLPASANPTPGSSGGSRPLAPGPSPSSWGTRSSEGLPRWEEAPENATELSRETGWRRGTFVLPGLYKQKKASLDLVVTKEIRVQGVFSHDFRAVRPAIKMAGSGKYPFEELITHTLPLAQAERAVRLVAGEIEGGSPLKVVLDPKG
jgi:hypothetical protein